MRVDGRGAGGDRTHAVLYEHKGAMKPLTAREAPRLLAWQAAYPFNFDGGLDPARPAATPSSRRRTGTASAGETRACASRSRTTSADPCSSRATSRASRTSGARS